jgi:hypothetical protein
MVDGRKPDPVLTLYSVKEKAGGYYGLGSVLHSIQYVIEGSFMGSLLVQASLYPNPVDAEWVDIAETKQIYVGLETTGGAGISGGFSGAISHPVQTNLKEFTGNYAWLRIRMDFSRGTLHSATLNF